MQYKVFSLLEPTPGKVVEFEKNHPRLMKLVEPLGTFMVGLVERHTKIVLDKYETMVHPQEDYLKVSMSLPIFAVADGVTLEFNPDGTYPNPSRAGEVAKIFCETVVTELEKSYATFKPENMLTAFRAANIAVGEYNRSHGRTKETSNFLDHDLFACTAAFALYKDGVIYTATLCDAATVYFDAQGKQVEHSPVCWTHERQEKFLPKDWEGKSDTERKNTVRRLYRNGVSEEGKCTGYGVATGEASAEKYVVTSTRHVSPGELLFLASDGFEPYLALPEFVGYFQSWSADLEERVRNKTLEMGKKDPATFAHERSIIAVSFF